MDIASGSECQFQKTSRSKDVLGGKGPWLSINIFLINLWACGSFQLYQTHPDVHMLKCNICD